MPAWLPSLAYLGVVIAVARRPMGRGAPTMADMCLTYAPGAIWLLPLLCLLAFSVHSGSLASAAIDAASAAVVLRDLMEIRVGAGRDRRATSPEGKRLRVATFNVYGGALDIDRCLAFLARTDADVIFLQEAWWTFSYRKLDTRPVIGAAFHGWHVFHSGDAHELMIISRHPLTETHERPLANRRCITAVTHTSAGPIRLVNVHLDPPATGRRLRQSGLGLTTFMLETERARRRQGEALADLVAESDLPTVVAGDLNSPPCAYARRILRPLLGDAFEAAGRGFGYTYPQRLPLWRIDYIMTSGHLDTERCTVGQVVGSDHLPLVADLRVRPAPTR